MATVPPGDLVLASIDDEARTLTEWLTTFHLAAVILDPYTYESSWLLETAGRVLEEFRGADCRVAFVITGPPEDARQFLGPWTDRVLTYADTDRDLVKALGLNELPAFVYIAQDLQVRGAAEGWDPAEWRAVTRQLADDTSWSAPHIPAPGDPAPFAGSPALG